MHTEHINELCVGKMQNLSNFIGGGMYSYRCAVKGYFSIML